MGIRQVLPTSVVIHCAFAVSDCERSAFAGHPAQSLCAQLRALDPSPGAILTQILPVAGQLAWPNVAVEVVRVVVVVVFTPSMLASLVPIAEHTYSLGIPHRAGDRVSWNGTTVLGHVPRNGTQGVSFQLRAGAQRGGRPLFGEGDTYIPPTLKSTPPHDPSHNP